MKPERLKANVLIIRLDSILAYFMGTLTKATQEKEVRTNERIHLLHNIETCKPRNDPERGANKN